MTDDDTRTPPYYDRDFVEREFTPQQVASQGRHLLYRALNIGRAVGFIGSGVAAAYGRPTWSELIDEPGAEIIGQIEQDAARQGLNKPRKGPVIQAVKTLKGAWVEGVSDPDLLPLQGHLYRTLGNAGPDEEDLIQQFVKTRVRDDDFVTQRAWEVFLRDMRVDLSESERKLWSGPECDPRVWRGLDTWGVLLEIIERLSAFPPFGPILDCLRQRATDLDDRLSIEQRCILPLAFAVSSLLGLDHEVFAIFERRRRQLIARFSQEQAAPAGSGTAPRAFSSADGGRCPRLDPARIIMDRLRIRRLLTTNYDFELERALERMGFEEKKLRPATPSERADVGGRERVAARPRGDRARTMVLKRDTAADLIGFGSQASDYDYEIFHLHGRAFAGADERLVITERDYQAVYMRDAPEAHVMEEAMAATMGGNPVIFLGMGMLEADVLRPLRRFVSGPGGQSNRSIIALLPTEESHARRMRASLLLYVRYGVHVIFYGDPEADEADEERPQRDFHDAPWLTSYAGPTADSAPLYRSIARLARIKSALSLHGGAELKALNLWLRGALAFGDIRAEKVEEMLGELAWQTFTPDNGRAWDQAWMAALKKAVGDLFLRPDFWLDLDEPSSAAAHARHHLRRFFTELDGRIRTRALCGSLESLVKKRQDWWVRWREKPRRRRFAHAVGINSDGVNWDPEQGLQQPLLGRGSATYRSVRYGMNDRPDRFDAKRQPEALRDKEIEDALSTLLAPTKSDKRRIFVAHGEGGSGRGTLFHALADRFASPPGHTAGARPYAWGLFTNATFSTEYSSVVDGVVDFLGLLWMTQTQRRSNERRGEAFRMSRCEQLVEHLNKLYGPPLGAARGDGRRGLFVIGGIELLFNRQDGSPKNTEIIDTLSVLLRDQMKDYPIDIIFICRSENVQMIFGDVVARDGPQLLRFGGELHDPIEGTPKDKQPAYKGQRFDAQLVKLARRQTRLLINDTLARHGLGSPRDIAGDDWATYADHQPDWRRAMKGRFETAIITACAVETLKDEWRRANPSQSGAEPNPFISPSGSAAVRDFLVDLGDMATRGDGRTRDVALMAVLRQYQALGPRRNKHALDPRKSSIFPDLCETILKHLAVMSTPLEISVLIRCPEIDAWLIGHDLCDEDVKVETIRDHLQWLLEHRLAFRVRSRREFLGAEHSDRFTRYSVHQSLQSYFYRQIDSPHLELGDSRLFTVSLFASQRSDLPAPSHTAYKFMTGLIRRLTAYPTDGFREPPSRPEWQRQDDVCALRAALGLTRSAFSLAVVSRFSEFGDPREPEHRAFGYMEEFRLLLRWMIFQSGMLGVEPVNTDDPEIQRSRSTDDEIRAVFKQLPVEKQAEWSLRDLGLDIQKSERINALYPDEITWLYNECGLVSLAQGNLNDAAALLKQALETNNLVEPGSDSGPNGLRIRLNRAVLALERGFLGRATQDLIAVQNQARREPTVYAIAKGYQGLVDHLKGRREAARTRYLDAIERLRKIDGEGRAVSIFCRHLGNLVRSSDLKEARQHHSDALAEAETARQHDQVHRIYISMVQDDLSEGAASGQSTRKILRRLDEVIQYADRMELYNLKIEALTARAKAIDQQGETQGAGHAAVNALSLSNLYGQRLRAVGAMNTLAGIIADRPGYHQQAWRILGAARAMAEAADYQLILEKAERRLIELGALMEP